MGKSVIFILMVILMTTVVAAQQIEEYTVKVNLVGKSAVVDYAIKSDFSKNLELKLPTDAKILDISEQNYDFKNGVLNVLLDRELTLEYLSKDFVEALDKNYFVADFGLPFDINKFSLEVVLPEGAVLDDPKSVFPKPEISSDGLNIILSWEKENIFEGESFPVFIIYKDERAFPPWLLAVLVVAFALIILFLNFKRKSYSKEVVSKEPPVKVVTKKEPVQTKPIHLLETESKVVKALRAAGGEMWQKQIQIKTGFSKAKLSRVIRDLEARGMLKRIPLGNTNKIKLI